VAPPQESNAPIKGKWDRVWPKVDTPNGARWAIKQAFWAAVLVVSVTTLFALIGASAWIK
jgi:hypothetical protein